MSNIYNIPVTRIDGTPGSLEAYRGRVLLVVNVASKCGLTPQYLPLENLYSRYRDHGLVVLGFPANDFAGQEPGSNSEIAQFCATQYNVTFPLFGKMPVTGPNRQPLYNALIEAQPTSIGEGKEQFIEGLIRFGVQPNHEPELLWNFEKFLIARNGEVVARFSPDTSVEDPVILSAIERELARR